MAAARGRVGLAVTSNRGTLRANLILRVDNADVGWGLCSSTRPGGPGSHIHLPAGAACVPRLSTQPDSTTLTRHRDKNDEIGKKTKQHAHSNVAQVLRF